MLRSGPGLSDVTRASVWCLDGVCSWRFLLAGIILLLGFGFVAVGAGIPGSPVRRLAQRHRKHQVGKHAAHDQVGVEYTIQLANRRYTDALEQRERQQSISAREFQRLQRIVQGSGDACGTEWYGFHIECRQRTEHG